MGDMSGLNSDVGPENPAAIAAAAACAEEVLRNQDTAELPS
jgi:hypothetical protein